MADAKRITGYTRETITKAAGRGEIPGAIKPPGRTNPWWFTVAGLRRWIGIRDDEAGAA